MGCLAIEVQVQFC